MAKAKPLSELVAEGVHKSTQQRTWFGLLPDEAQKELADVRQRFAAGEYAPARSGTVARVLIAHCQERGWKTCDHKRVAEWLRNG